MSDVSNIHAYWIKRIQTVNPLQLYSFPNFFAIINELFKSYQLKVPTGLKMFTKGVY